MKCISWNVNGLRACMGKGFADFFAAANADLFCLQETKLQAGQIDFAPPGYHAYCYAFPAFYFATVYVPNSQRELTRLDYRMQWEDDFLAYLQTLDQNKPVIFCGDLNVAHREIDLKNPKTNHKNAGFTDEERGKMTALLGSGFTDTFRYFYPDATGIYSWWSYMFHAREKNAGWRIDYFITSDRLQPKLQDAKIHTDIFGSDHCPIELDIDL